MKVDVEDVFVKQIDGRGRVVIPASKRRELGLDTGDEVEFVVLGHD